MDAPKEMSPKTVFWTQAITWSVLLLVMALRMPDPTHEIPVCPSVLTSLFDSSGIPKNAAGLSFGVVAIGFLWWCSGLLSWVYTRWPKLSYFRASAARVMGPQARRIGPLVMLGGVLLGFAIQAGCTLT